MPSFRHNEDFHPKQFPKSLHVLEPALPVVFTDMDFAVDWAQEH